MFQWVIVSTRDSPLTFCVFFWRNEINVVTLHSEIRRRAPFPSEELQTKTTSPISFVRVLRTSLHSQFWNVRLFSQFLPLVYAYVGYMLTICWGYVKHIFLRKILWVTYDLHIRQEIFVEVHEDEWENRQRVQLTTTI